MARKSVLTVAARVGAADPRQWEGAPGHGEEVVAAEAVGVGLGQSQVQEVETELSQRQNQACANIEAGRHSQAPGTTARE